MGAFERRLSEFDGAVLYKQASGGFVVELVDDCLVPTVRVTRAGKVTTVPLEKLGLYWSDGDNKFYLEATGDEVRPGEVNDLAVEHHLGGFTADAEGA